MHETTEPFPAALEERIGSGRVVELEKQAIDAAVGRPPLGEKPPIQDGPEALVRRHDDAR
jgi:hypothetical protein